MRLELDGEGSILYLSPKRLNDLRILQIGFRERPLPPEARELAR